MFIIPKGVHTDDPSGKGTAANDVQGRYSLAVSLRCTGFLTAGRSALFGVNLVADIGSLAVRIATPDDDIVERVSVTLTSTTDEGGVIIAFEDS